jgi:hypothetical protein
MSKVKSYSFRSECFHDLVVLQKLLGKNATKKWDFSYEMDPKFPDCNAKIKTRCTIEELYKIFKMVPDGHVMCGTLNYSDRYTGSRREEHKWQYA